MRTVDIASQTPTLDTLLDLAGEETLILTTPDGREFVLAEVDDLAKEIELIRKNQALREFLKERSQTTKTYTMRQVREMLQL